MKKLILIAVISLISVGVFAQGPHHGGGRPGPQPMPGGHSRIEHREPHHFHPNPAPRPAPSNGIRLASDIVYLVRTVLEPTPVIQEVVVVPTAPTVVKKTIIYNGITKKVITEYSDGTIITRTER